MGVAASEQLDQVRAQWVGAFGHRTLLDTGESWEDTPAEQPLVAADEVKATIDVELVKSQ
jgi:hypothetical protein